MRWQKSVFILCDKFGMLQYETEEFLLLAEAYLLGADLSREQSGYSKGLLDAFNVFKEMYPMVSYG